MRAGVKAQRDRRDIFDGFRINLGFQIQGEPRPGFALVGCHLRLQRTGDGDRGDNQDDGHDDQEFDERKAALTVQVLLWFAGLCSGAHDEIR